MIKGPFECIYDRLRNICEKSEFARKRFKFSLYDPAGICAKCRRFFRRKGTAVLEAALCLPILLYLFFFTIEALRIGVYQVAVDNMALKLAFEYSGLKSSTNFSKVIDDSKPAFFKSMDGIFCKVYLFSDLDTLMSNTYAATVSEDPSWERMDNPDIQKPGSTVSVATTGTAFVVTVAYNFPFSSPFIKKLFAGGKNYGDHFLLWGRAIGVCS